MERVRRYKSSEEAGSNEDHGVGPCFSDAPPTVARGVAVDEKAGWQARHYKIPETFRMLKVAQFYSYIKLQQHCF